MSESTKTLIELEEWLKTKTFPNRAKFKNRVEWKNIIRQIEYEAD